MPLSLSSGFRWRVIEVPRPAFIALLDGVGAVAGGLPAGGGSSSPARRVTSSTRSAAMNEE